MEIEYFGANCIRLSTKQAKVVIDDNLADLGAKPVTREADIALFTSTRPTEAAKSRMVIDSPGEYEVSGVAITGVAARAHTDEEGKKSATIFKILADDTRAVVLGHIYPELSDEQLEALGVVDVLFVPVGGHGFTLDAAGALHIIKEIEPKIVIPTYYGDNTLKYPVPADSLAEALKAMGMEASETVDKLKLKSMEPTDSVKLVVINKG